jgi:hypothetical protein
MSPLKKASTVTGLRRATAPAPATMATAAGPYLCTRCETGSHCRGDETCMCKCGKTKRVTLDLDPETYDTLNQWLGSAAAEVGAPVSKARALRAMIKAVSLDKSVGLVVVDLVRRDGQP